MGRILLVDDEANILQVLSCMLRSKKHEVVSTTEGQKAIDYVRAENFDLLISDLRMNPIDGIAILKVVKKEKPDLPVLMLTAFGSHETAREAIELGAFGYMLKPFNLQEMLITVQRALTFKTHPQAEPEEQKAVGSYQMDDLVAVGDAMLGVKELVKVSASKDTSMLICGEKGTGKSLVAKSVHTFGARKDNKLLVINCATLPEPLLELEMFGYVKGAFQSATTAKAGILESALHGTVLFDEIGWMPQTLQKKLVAALIEGCIRRVGGNENIPIDVRVITSSIMPAQKLVSEGNVLNDLYARLSQNLVQLPKLAERKDDILPLARHFLKSTAGAKLQPDAEKVLLAYSWPRNVRELENVMKYAVEHAPDGIITKAQLPPEIVRVSELPA
jgi:two-component system response regulator AtoC